MTETAMFSPRDDYAGDTAVMATMHGKEVAFAGPMKSFLGLNLVLAEGLDTDMLGTFTGEIPRTSNMLQTAVEKASRAIAICGWEIAITNEGSFGPHPYLPFASAGSELAVFIDARRGLEVHETILDHAPIYFNVEASCIDDVMPHLELFCFPDHRLIVRPLRPRHQHHPIFKGIASMEVLSSAIKEAADASADGIVLVQSDMRAHMNPRRMTMLAELASKLAIRVSTQCPSCGIPGFGQVDVETGLPCESCGQPTALKLREIWGCATCGFRESRTDRAKPIGANAANCTFCNP